MNTTAEPKQRMMHWTCSKCKHKWSEPIVQAKNYSPGTQRADAHETSFCDRCLNKMG